MNKIFGCVLGFFGIIVMNSGGSPEKSALLGDVLVLLCAAFTGLSHSLIKKFSQDDDPVFPFRLAAPAGRRGATAVGALMGGSLWPSAPGAILTLIALALISSVTGALWNALLKHNPVSSVNIYFFANPYSA